MIEDGSGYQGDEDDIIEPLILAPVISKEDAFEAHMKAVAAHRKAQEEKLQRLLAFRYPDGRGGIARSEIPRILNGEKPDPTVEQANKIVVNSQLTRRVHTEKESLPSTVTRRSIMPGEKPAPRVVRIESSYSGHPPIIPAKEVTSDNKIVKINPDGTTSLGESDERIVTPTFSRNMIKVGSYTLDKKNPVIVGDPPVSNESKPLGREETPRPPISEKLSESMQNFRNGANLPPRSGPQK